MRRLTLTLLGSPEISLGSMSLTDALSNKAQALLFYLAVTQRTCSRDTLAGLFWHDMPNHQARKNLRNILPGLRRLVGSHLTITRQTVAFNQCSFYWLDVEVLLSHQQASQTDWQKLQKAIDLYRGDFLTGFYVRDALAFEDWLLEQREYLREMAIQHLSRLVQHYLQQQEYELGLKVSKQLLAIEPWHEKAHQHQMLLLAYLGQRHAALAQYEICCAVLKDEFDAEPMAETTTLYKQIKAEQLGGKDREPVLTEKLTDFSRFSPSSAAIPKRRSSFSVASWVEETTLPCIAREHQLAQLKGFLHKALAGHGQVAFVTGEAGSGKTALIRELAWQAQKSSKELTIAVSNCSARDGLSDPCLPFLELLNLLTGGLEARLVLNPSGTFYSLANGTGELISQENVRRLWNLIPASVQVLLNQGPDLIGRFVPGSTLLTRSKTFLMGIDAETDPPFKAIPNAQWLDDLAALVASKAGATGYTPLEQPHLFQQLTNVLLTLAGPVSDEAHHSTRPLMLVLEDLQWADPATISLFFHLSRRLVGSRILLIGSYRSEALALKQPVHNQTPPSEGSDKTASQRHHLESVVNDLKHYFGDITVNLDCLDETARRQFSDALLDLEPNQLDTGFRQSLFDYAGGHPLFTIEVVGALRARGDLIQDKEKGWITGDTVTWDVLPVRVESLIKERVDRLETELREYLAIASVEGELFTAQVIAQIKDIPVQEVVRQLTQILDRKHQLIQETGIREIGRQQLFCYRFRYRPVKEYLYSSLSEIERTLLQEEVDNVLKCLGSDEI